MADVTVRSTVQVNDGFVKYRNAITSFNFDFVTASPKGPCVGVVAVPSTGVDISLTELTTPGIVVLTNQDPLNWVEVGVHDGTLFHPLLEVGPGECWPIRLSRNLGEEHEETGTGTTGTVNTLRAKCMIPGASINLLVEAFER